MKHPRAIDGALVDAYLARRALDYLVGFTLSPVLWRKLPGARSAGRVQSVALRLVCDRELEIEKFVAKEYWSIVAKLATPRGDSFEARLVGADGQKIQRLDIGSGAQAEADLKRDLESASFTVAAVEAKPARRNPPPPFTTSTMQQEASRKLGFAPAIAMRLAQRLYEGVEIDGETTGLITYMRTDGIDMAPEAIADIRAMLGKNYGKEYVPASPRDYHNKSKNAQEAHEAVRPTSASRTPGRGRQICRPRPGPALRADLESRGREPDGIRRARAHHRRYRRQGRQPHHRPARHRPGGEVRRLPHALSGRPGRNRRRRRVAPPAGDGAGRGARQAGDRSRAAFHRAAAALLRSGAGQAHGRARHRPALDLRLDPASAAGPRLCAHRQEAADPRGQGPRRRRLPGKLLHSATSNTISPPRSKSSSTASPTTRSIGRRCCEDFWTGFIGAVNDIKELRITAGARRAQRAARAAHLPGARRRRRRAPVPAMRHRQAVARSRTLRRLHRLLELSGMQLHPADDARAPTAAQRAPRCWATTRTPVSRSRCAAAASAPICSSASRSSRRSRRRARRAGSREAQARQPAERRRARRHRSRQGAGAAGAAARSRQHPGRRRADHRRRRPLRALRQARQDLRQPRRRRRRPHRRPQPRGAP